MSLDIFQVSFLAVIQGITEFLPVSSSGHLLLPSILWGWADQGLVFDVAVHIGSLTAVTWYFRQQLSSLARAWFASLRNRRQSEQSTLAWLLILATFPAGLSGLLLNDWVEQYARSLPVIAATSVFFGLLLFAADQTARKELNLSHLTWKMALLIGMAQVLALIPGTSRSGITMTAALAVNLNRHAASQFSFLLAIPIIAASGLLKGAELVQAGASSSEWIVLVYAAMVSAVVSWICIHYFLRLIERVGFLPFVAYRVLLGVVMFYLYLA